MREGEGRKAEPLWHGIYNWAYIVLVGRYWVVNTVSYLRIYVQLSPTTQRTAMTHRRLQRPSPSSARTELLSLSQAITPWMNRLVTQSMVIDLPRQRKRERETARKSTHACVLCAQKIRKSNNNNSNNNNENNPPVDSCLLKQI